MSKKSGGRSVRSGPPPSRGLLARRLQEAGIDLVPAQIDELWTYHTLLRRHNEDRDLTRIVGFEPMVAKHYVDCLILSRWLRPEGPVLDIGTGAGFPGIPLRIQYPDTEFVLAEPRPRRVAFLRKVIAQFGWKNVTVFEHKVVSRSFTRPIKTIITRALETMEKTLKRTEACAVAGTRYVFMKGPNVDEEIRTVKREFSDRVQLVQDEAYRLPGTSHERRLIVWSSLRGPG